MCDACGIAHPRNLIYSERNMPLIARTASDICLLQTGRVSCTNCVTVNAFAFCIDCQKYECLDCASSHGITTTEHLLEDLPTRKDKIPQVLEETEWLVEVEKMGKCFFHPSKRHSRYCPECEIFFCEECTSHHDGHEKFISVRDYFFSIRDDMITYLEAKRRKYDVVSSLMKVSYKSYRDRVQRRYEHNCNVLEQVMEIWKNQYCKTPSQVKIMFSQLRRNILVEKESMLEQIDICEKDQKDVLTEFSIMLGLGSCAYTPFSLHFMASLKMRFNELEKRIQGPKIHMHLFSIINSVNDNGLSFKKIDDVTVTLV